MRPAVLIVAALALALAATSGAANRKPPRAVAQAAVSGGTAYGEVRRNQPGDGEVDTAVDGDGVSAKRGLSRVRVSEGGTGEAVARAFDVNVLNGLVTASGARRDSDGGGAVYALRVEGRFLGDVERRRVIPITGGEVVLNSGNTALRVRTSDRDIRVAVAKATTRAFPTPTPSPSPSPSPRPSRRRPPARSRPPRRPPKRKKAPSVSARLTKGGYAFPIFGKARVADTFGAVRAAPIVSHEGVDIFAPFGSPVVAVAGRQARPRRHAAHLRQPPVAAHGERRRVLLRAPVRVQRRRPQRRRRSRPAPCSASPATRATPSRRRRTCTSRSTPAGWTRTAVDPYPIVTAWQDRDDVPPGAWLQQLGADATERPGALVTVRDFIAE